MATVPMAPPTVRTPHADGAVPPDPRTATMLSVIVPPRDYLENERCDAPALFVAEGAAALL